MPDTHTGWAGRYAQHVLAAALAYLAIFAIFNMYETYTRHPDIILYASIIYASTILVPPVRSVVKRIIFIVPMFYLSGLIVFLLLANVEKIDEELFIIPAVFVVNFVTLMFVLFYAALCLLTRKFFYQ